MLIFSALLFGAAIYCITANFLQVPSFKVSRAFRQDKQEKDQWLQAVINTLAAKLAIIYPMNIVQKSTVQKLLNAANKKETPQYFMSLLWIKTVLPAPIAIPLAFINPILVVLPFTFSFYMYNHQMNMLKNQGEKRRQEVEKEMPRFVAYISNTLKTERNVLTCIYTYTANYSTPLTQELSITAADMHSGNSELALQRFETRCNSPFVSQLVRGLLSSMRGNDMTAYFENLSYSLTNVWEQRLRGQALRKQPKIERMSYILFGIAMITVFAVIIATLSSSASLLGGM